MKFSKTLLSSFVLSSLFFATSCSSTKTGQSRSPKAAPVAKADAKSPGPEELKTVYFDYNKDEIRKDQRSTANGIAKFLKANPNVSIQIQGNTDSRGSPEHNMALGLKRAQSLEKFLLENGVKNSIETISYGKERPASQGNNEEAWSKNRRDDVVKIK